MYSVSVKKTIPKPQNSGCHVLTICQSVAAALLSTLNS